MRPRISLARLFIRIGRIFTRTGSIIESSAMMVMRPEDLIEFSRQTYVRHQSVDGWSSLDLVDEGLYPEEKELLAQLPQKQGRLLLLGVGGGREAIPLAKLGYQVTGVDFVAGMVEQAKKNAARQGLTIEGLIQEISSLELEEEAYDVVWLSAEMYSCVPTRKKRIAMLWRIYRALRPDGTFVCQFHWGSDNNNSSKIHKARKALAWLTLGNTSYEPGDMLWHKIEFIHGFLSKDELLVEFEAGGFEVLHLHVPEHKMRGGAVLKKNVKGNEHTDDRDI